jgi:hypothetical protein
MDGRLMDTLKALLAEVEAASANHDAVYRAAFASGRPYASLSTECRQANERIELANSALSRELRLSGWKPGRAGEEYATYNLKAAALRLLEPA